MNNIPFNDKMSPNSNKSETKSEDQNSENSVLDTETTPMAPLAEYDKTPQSTSGDNKSDELPPPPTVTSGDAKKSRHYEDEELSCATRTECMFVVALSVLMLIASVVLVIFWVMTYRGSFAWTEDPKLEFNLHPVLMITGFIFFSGGSMLFYRIFPCCSRMCIKLAHTIFHALAIPCIVVGFLAVLDSHNLADPPIPNFYSLHSWLGLATMGLFALQFAVGFFSFLILLCCEGATEGCRAALVPIHSTFGIIVFHMAIATCLTGLTEKVLYTLERGYSKLPIEGIIVNTLAVVLAALGILVAYIVRREPFRRKFKSVISERL